MLQDLGRQREVLGQLLQHLLVGAGRAGGGLLDHRQAELDEEDLADLLRTAQVERLAGQLMGLAFELHDALAQFMALRRQRGRVDQHAIALDPVQRLAAGDLEFVDEQQLRVATAGAATSVVHVQRLVGVLAGVFGGAGDVDLVEPDLVRTLAAQVLVLDAGAAQVAFGQAGQPVRPVHLEHITLQHGVVPIPCTSMPWLANTWRSYLTCWPSLWLPVLQPGLEPRQHLVARQLVRRAGVVVGQRHIRRLAGYELKLTPTISARISSSEVVSVSTATSSAAISRSIQRSSAAQSRMVSYCVSTVLGARPTHPVASVPGCDLSVVAVGRRPRPVGQRAHQPLETMGLVELLQALGVLLRRWRWRRATAGPEPIHPVRSRS